MTDTLSTDKIGSEEELQNIYRIWKLATNRSLILIDEPGKSNSLHIKYLDRILGCSLQDSLALVLTIIQRFSQNRFPRTSESGVSHNGLQSDDCKESYENLPTTIITTHLRELYQQNLIQENYILRFYMMEAIIERAGRYYGFAKYKSRYMGSYKENMNITYLPLEDAKLFNDINENKLIYRYKIKPGFSLNSFAIFCGRKVGMQKAILDRVVEILNSDSLEKKTMPSEFVRKCIIKDMDDFTTKLVENIQDYLV